MYNGSSIGNVAISSNFLLHSSMLGPSDCSNVLRTTSNFASRSPSLFSFGTSFLVKTFLLMMKGLVEIQDLYLCVYKNSLQSVEHLMNVCQHHF